jgi:hypothetical protein
LADERPRERSVPHSERAFDDLDLDALRMKKSGSVG